MVFAFVPHVPLMRRIVQEGHGVHNLLCITNPHKGEVVAHKGCLGMDILRVAPIEAQWLLGLPLH